VSIEGGQRPRAPHGLLAVPGDPSSAAFFLVGAALIPKSEVTVRGLLLNPTRTGFLEVMRRMGADITVERLGEDLNAPTRTATFGVELIGDVTVRYRSSLHATKVAAEEVPSLIDELPILALLATSAKGTTTFEGVGELRVKESDRLAAIEEGLRVFGREARSEGDTLFVTGCPSQAGGAVAQAQGARDATLNTYGDHRLAMTWTIANHALGLRHPLDDPACMSVSYPDFLTDLASLCA
jgi:3-phosphoshikimate 1-carboxyvinyltransferase